MVIYFILIAFVLIFGKIYDKNEISKKQFIIICYIFFTALGGLRSFSVGTDTYMYSAFYIGFDGNFMNSRFEPGFLMLCEILKKISDNPRILLIATSVIINFGYFYFIYNCTDKVKESLLIYVFLNFYFDTYNLMRQEIAASILLIGIVFFLKERYKIFFVFWMIACQFHNSCYAYIAIFAYMFIYKNLKLISNKVFFIIVATLFIYFVAPNIYNFVFSRSQIHNTYNYYTNSIYIEKNTFGSVLMSMMFFGIYAYIVFNKKYIYNVDEKNYLFYSSNILCAAFLYTAAIQIELFSRFVHYFSASAIIILPEVMITNTKKKRLETMFVYAILFLYWIVIAKYRSFWNGAVPYRLL